MRTVNPGASSSMEVKTQYSQVSYKANNEKSENKKYRALFASEKVYFAILRDMVFEIGRLSSPDSSKIMMVRVPGMKDINDLTRQFKNLKKIEGKEQQLQSVIQFELGFKRTDISTLNDQDILLESIRKLTVSDKMERGCFLKITEEDSGFRIYLENAFTVGNKDEVKFRFPLNSYGSLSLLERRGDILIGTVHSHSHDGGLSGVSSFEIAEGKGDISNIKLTKIPWIVIGPNSIEAGYLNNYGNVVVENPIQQNLALYALSRMAIKS